MAAFAFGFRDMLEAALIIGFALAAVVRLGRGQLAQALWVGAGAGALLGFSIGTGLAAAEASAIGSGWTGFEITAMALSFAALAGLVLAGRRYSAESGPCLWLAVGAGLLAALPQTLDLVTHVSANAGGMASLAMLALGTTAAAALAAAITTGLIRVKLGQGSARETQPVSGELAPVRQRVD